MVRVKKGKGSKPRDRGGEGVLATRLVSSGGRRRGEEGAESFRELGEGD